MILLLLLSISTLTAAYEESAQFRSFGQGLLAVDFTFKQSIEFPLDNNGRTFGSFPKPIYEIFYEYQLQALRLTMSKTRWMYDKWGQPEWQAAPLGVSLGAVLKNETPYGRYRITEFIVVPMTPGIDW